MRPRLAAATAYRHAAQKLRDRLSPGHADLHDLAAEYLDMARELERADAVDPVVIAMPPRLLAVQREVR